MEIIRKDVANNQTRVWIEISNPEDSEKNAIFLILPDTVDDKEILRAAKVYRDKDISDKEDKLTLKNLLAQQEVLAQQIEELKLKFYGFTDKR